MKQYLKISPAVQKALDEGRPVIALESTIISHGMPYPQNLETARLCEAEARKNGAEPATVAVIHGQLCAGGDLRVLAVGHGDLIGLAGVVPERSGSGGSDGDTALLFLDHPVHGCGTLVHFTDLVRLAGVEKNPFGSRRLAGIDVRHDADVAGESKISVCHLAV